LAVEWNDFLPGNGTFGEVKVKDETWENGRAESTVYGIILVS